MEQAGFLLSAFVFLAAAVAVVPLAKKGGLGSVLGYLIAGILIGPFCLGLVKDTEDVMHFSEYGVVLMLFLIGMELKPRTLWAMRKPILGLGGLQVLLTTMVLSALLSFFMAWQMALAIGAALSLSSTAMVLQIMNEKNLVKTPMGQNAFSVLLFQDIAVIPLLAMLPLLATIDANSDVGHGVQHSVFDLPAWLEPFKILIVVGVIVFAGRYLIHHAFRYITESRMREIFTASSLLLIIGVALLMQSLGLSAALGAFVAGVVLANSEYRHTLEADIEPFKGLLLGLFFISVGMSINFDTLMAEPLVVVISVIVLIAVKAGILFGLSFLFNMRTPHNRTFTVLLSQGGEFAFVISQVAVAGGVLLPDIATIVSAVVALSMLTTPILMIVNDRFIIKSFGRSDEADPEDFDTIDHHGAEIIIAGYGRFGQIIGRFLIAQGHNPLILEQDPQQIGILRRFGNKVYFGDPTRLDVLKSAGAADAKILVVTFDDPDRILSIVHLAKEHFPHLKIFARARNRRHAYELHKAGVDVFRRELFDSSLWIGRQILQSLGMRAYDARNRAMKFMYYDEDVLHRSFEFFENEKDLISFARRSQDELEIVLADDHHGVSDLNRRSGWGSGAGDKDASDKGMDTPSKAERQNEAEASQYSEDHNAAKTAQNTGPDILDPAAPDDAVKT